MKFDASRSLPGMTLALALGVLVLEARPQQVAATSARATATDPRLVGVRPGPGEAGSNAAIEALAAQDPAFAAGRALFDRDFHQADGLGAPELNADSCRGCHQDPVIGGAGGLELNVTRFGDDGYGSYRFQNLPGGQGLSKLQPPWTPVREEYDPLTATVFEQRQTPSILGAGRIDSVPDDVILANEDPTDRDRDGIFGVARLRVIGGQTEVGRFGWKAQAPRLSDFVMDAMGGELGITTPDDGRGFAMVSDADSTPDPELSSDEVELIHHFMSKLPAPERRQSDLPEVALGEALFESIGCAVCHVPSLESPAGPVPLYSNLLLHDVMPAGYRGMSEPGAGMGMFRTPPLWGIRDTAPYMHDGRASDLAAAIRSHDGEAAGVVQQWEALPPSEQAAVILFLEHL